MLPKSLLDAKNILIICILNLNYHLYFELKLALCLRYKQCLAHIQPKGQVTENLAVDSQFRQSGTTGSGDKEHSHQLPVLPFLIWSTVYLGTGALQ